MTSVIRKSSLQVLLAEDNVVNQMIIGGMLERAGHTVVFAADGGAAFEALVSMPQIELVLMDCQMPKVDGFAATQRIRRELPEPARSVPIVALTALNAGTDRQSCLSAGMNDFLSKPVEQGDLVAMIERYCIERKVPTNELPCIDGDVLSQLRKTEIADGPPLLTRLIGVFVHQTDAVLAGMALAAAKGDRGALRFGAHKIKSGAGSLGALNLAAVCATLEAVSDAATDDVVAELFSELKATYSAARATLQALPDAPARS